MPINWSGLQQQSFPQARVVANLPSSGGGEGGGIGELFEGLSSLVGAFKGTGQTGGQATPVSSPTAGTGQNVVNSMMGVRGQQGGLQGQLQQSTTLGNHDNFFDSALKQVGLREGSPVLNSYLQKANPNLDPKTTPWCAGFVGSVLNAGGIKGTGSLMAKSYLNYGQPVKQPSRGDIVVFNDMSGSNNPSKGHVGFVDRVENGQVWTLGGNQDNAISLKPYSMNQVAGFRRPPSGQEVQQYAQQHQIQSPMQLASITKEPQQQLAANSHPSLQATMNGIAHVESSSAKNPYALMSKPSRNGDRAYGKYQIMGNNIPSWTKAATGRAMSKQEFLNSPEAQDKTAGYWLQKSLDKYGNPEDAAAVWFTGQPRKNYKGAKDVYGTDLPSYLKKFQKGMKQSLDTNERPLLPQQLPPKPPIQTASMQGLDQSYPGIQPKTYSPTPVLQPQFQSNMPMLNDIEEPQGSQMSMTRGIDWSRLMAMLNQTSGRQA